MASSIDGMCDYELQDKNTVLVIYKLSPATLDIISRVNKIHLHKYFNESIDILSKYDNITELDLSTSFNILVNSWPPKLKKLDLGVSYNHPIDNLPEGLESLYIGSDFNKSIDNVNYLLLCTARRAFFLSSVS